MGKIRKLRRIINALQAAPTELCLDSIARRSWYNMPTIKKPLSAKNNVTPKNPNEPAQLGVLCEKKTAITARARKPSKPAIRCRVEGLKLPPILLADIPRIPDRCETRIVPSDVLSNAKSRTAARDQRHTECLQGPARCNCTCAMPVRRDRQVADLTRQKNIMTISLY